MNTIIASPAEITGSENPNLVRVGQYNDGSQDWFVYVSDKDDSAEYPGSKLIGAWNVDGTVAQDFSDPENPIPIPIDPDYETYIRPFGNEDIVERDEQGNEIGRITATASDSQDFSCFWGHRQRYMQAMPTPQYLSEYPLDIQPWLITMTRTEILDDGFPQTPWGFHIVIDFFDPARSPDARSIGVYADANCTQFLWTPGAYIFQEPIVDPNTGEEIPGYWYIDCPVGQRTAERTDWYVANLFGSAQEGKYTMFANQDQFTRFFWDRSASGGNSWIDTGQTVTGNFGTITGVQDKTAFSVASKVRIEGFESEVVSLWAGGEGIELTPNRQYTVGAPIEIWGTTQTVTDLGQAITYNSENVTYAGT